MSDDRIEFDPASVRDLAEAAAWARARLPGALVMLALVDGSKLLPLDLHPPPESAASFVVGASEPEPPEPTDDVYALVEAIEARFSPILADGYHVFEPEGWSGPVTAYVLRARVSSTPEFSQCAPPSAAKPTRPALSRNTYAVTGPDQPAGSNT